MPIIRSAGGKLTSSYQGTVTPRGTRPRLRAAAAPFDLCVWPSAGGGGKNVRVRCRRLGCPFRGLLPGFFSISSPELNWSTLMCKFPRRKNSTTVCTGGTQNTYQTFTSPFREASKHLAHVLNTRPNTYALDKKHLQPVPTVTRVRPITLLPGCPPPWAAPSDVPEAHSPRRAGAEEVNRRFRGRFESEVALLERRFLAHQPEAGPNQLRESRCFIIYWPGFTP